MSISTKQNKLLYLLFLLMPFIDMFTGYLFNVGIDSIFSKIGQIYRIFFIVYLSYLIFLKNKSKKCKWLILFSIYLVGLVFLYNIRFGSSIISNMTYAIKLLFPIYLCYGVSYKINKTEFDVKKVFEAYSWIFPLSLIIPKMLDLGFYNYYNDSGFKGFYYANNEVNVILAVLFVYCFNKLYKKITMKNLIRIILCAVALLLIGSKTSIIVIPIVTAIFLIFKIRLKKEQLFKAGFGILGICAVSAIFLSEQIKNVFDRFIFMYNYYLGRPNAILTFLLSERNLRIGPAIDHWFIKDKYGIINFLFGIGKEEKTPTDTIYGIYSIIEMDFFDIMFWFGIIVAIIVLAFYLIVFIRACLKRGCFSEKVMFALTMTFSMLAGHVMMSANAGTILGLVLAALYTGVSVDEEKILDNIEIKTIDKKKRLAVLMSTYNGEQYIREQIDSILEQKTDFEVELLVRDDGSTDATKDILQEYAEKGKLQWFTGENLKPAKSFLSLLKSAKDYDFYAFADQDDVWDSDKLQYGVSAILDKEGPALSFSNARLVDANKNYLGRILYKNSPATDFYSLVCGCSVIGCTVVFNKELASLVQAKPIPEALVMHETYLSLLCSSFDGTIVYDANPHMDYRQHESNVVGTKWTKIDAVKDRLNDILKPRKVSFASMAESLCKLYPNLPDEKKGKFLRKVANYRNSFIQALCLAFDHRTEYDSLNKEITIRLSILFRNR